MKQKEIRFAGTKLCKELNTEINILNETLVSWSRIKKEMTCDSLQNKNMQSDNN